MTVIASGQSITHTPSLIPNHTHLTIAVYPGTDIVRRFTKSTERGGAREAWRDSDQAAATTDAGPADRDRHLDCRVVDDPDRRPLVRADNHGSAARTGVTTAIWVLPVILSGALAGPIVDRIGHKRSGVLGDVGAGLCVALVPTLYHSVGLAFPLTAGDRLRSRAIRLSGTHRPSQPSPSARGSGRLASGARQLRVRHHPEPGAAARPGAGRCPDCPVQRQQRDVDRRRHLRLLSLHDGRLRSRWGAR